MSIVEKNGIHFHLDAIQDIAGFALASGKRGDTIPILARALITSDEPEFYKYIENLSNPIFNKVGVFQDAVYQVLIIIHSDSSAELFINDFLVAVEMMAKRDVKKGEIITNCDIADIRRLNFPRTKIVDTDKVIYCSKVGWKFGLFFDLDRRDKLDIKAMELDLGKLNRYLSFQYIYEVLANEAQFEEMIKDGWFPFIEIIGGEYKALKEIYENKFDFDNRIEKLIESFNKERIEKITNKWWRKPVFNDNKEILQAGLMHLPKL
ncbi:hypothetical protein ACFLV6_00210 [Chloroflexota bacterium]